MSNIRIDIDGTIKNGSEIVFIAPCDCSEISKLNVYHLDEEGNNINSSFIFKDAHGNELFDIDLFAKGVYVKVILNITEGIAYIQNADTNQYLEGRFDSNAVTNIAIGTNPTAQDSTDAPIISQIINGYTVQDGTPTSDTPVEIESLGELQSDGSYKVAVRTCGKNLFNPNTVISGEIIEADGTFRAYTAEENYTRSLYSRSDYIPCNANTNYYFENVMPLSVAYMVGCYDENKQFLRKLSFSGNSATVSGVLNTGDNTKYMVVCYKTTNVDTVMVAKSDTATEYEPYTETTAELSLSEPLYEGDYIKYRANGSGVLHRSMCGAVFDGSDDEGWGKSATTGTNRYYVYINDIFASLDCNFLCSQAIRVNNTSTTANSVAFVTPAKQFAINTEFSTLEEWKAWLAENPMTVVYELATPTEIELTAEQVEQFKQLYTFEPVTNILCDGETETTYYKATDNGEVVSALHKKVDSTNKSIESLNESLKETDTVVGGAVGANGDTNVSYTDIQDIDPDGNIYFSQENGGSLVNGLKNATSQIRGMFASLKNVFSLKTHNHDDTYVKKEEFTGFKYLKTVDLANYAELGPEYRAKVGQLGFDRYMFNLRATQTYDYSEHDVDIMNIIKPANEPVMKHIPPVMGLNSSYTSIVSFFSGVVYISDGDVEFVLSIDAGGTNPKVPSDYRVDIYGAMD